jgi:hypothetical protein
LNDGSGVKDVPFYTYGEKHVEGYAKVVEAFFSKKAAAIVPILIKPMLGLKVPVFRNANVGLKTMQPLFFSHGLTMHRMGYSALYQELASCGYCVVAMTHGDGSSDYQPKAGFFEEGFKQLDDYWGRNFEVRVREKEMNAVVKEFTNQFMI